MYSSPKCPVCGAESCATEKYPRCVGCGADIWQLAEENREAARRRVRKPNNTRGNRLEMQLYFFETHDQAGQMQAATFQDAMRQLCAMVSYGQEGAWGWVEDLDGDRFTIGIVP